MADEVRPALTPDEWAARRYEGYGLRVFLRRYPHAVTCCIVGGQPVEDGREQGGVGSELSDDELPAVMALANAALPDLDPRRITQADVRLVRAAAEAIRAAGVYLRADDAGERLDALATKLAALIPPDGTR